MVGLWCLGRVSERNSGPGRALITPLISSLIQTLCDVGTSLRNEQGVIHFLTLRLANIETVFVTVHTVCSMAPPSLPQTAVPVPATQKLTPATSLCPKGYDHISNSQPAPLSREDCICTLKKKKEGWAKDGIKLVPSTDKCAPEILCQPANESSWTLCGVTSNFAAR